MLDCPRCHQAVDAQALTCPYCHTTLKAHGHPGIPLYRSAGKDYLCQTCIYDADDTCTFPQRPYAKECTLYSNSSLIAPAYAPPRGQGLKLWLRRNGLMLVVLGIVAIGLLLALTG